MGDRKKHLTRARRAIEKTCGPILQQSAIYETEAWGIKEQPAFLNQALAIGTPLSPETLLHTILRIEETLGRKREIKYGPRTIDIDIALFNDAIIRLPDLKIPHPQMQNRRFALQCLHDIAAEKIHPVFKKTIAQLLAECPDPLAVNKFS